MSAAGGSAYLALAHTEALTVLYRLRWRLARRIAPVPLMADPYPDIDSGVFVVARLGNGSSVTLKADLFRMKTTNRLGRFDYRPEDPFTFPRFPQAYTRFVGTVLG